MTEQFVIATFLVVAVVELIKRAFDKDLRTVAIIVGAGVTGGVLGWLGIEGLTVLKGTVLGLTASGVVNIATRAGGK